MAPSPLLKMDLYLVGKNITYIPSKIEIQDTFTTVLEEIVHIISSVPRLYEKFSLPSGGLRKFHEVIATDPDCNKLQRFINDGKLWIELYLHFTLLRLFLIIIMKYSDSSKLRILSIIIFRN